jgi:hypothetical protein
MGKKSFPPSFWTRGGEGGNDEQFCPPMILWAASWRGRKGPGPARLAQISDRSGAHPGRDGKRVGPGLGVVGMQIRVYVGIQGKEDFVYSAA